MYNYSNYERRANILSQCRSDVGCNAVGMTSRQNTILLV